MTMIHRQLLILVALSFLAEMSRPQSSVVAADEPVESVAVRLSDGRVLSGVPNDKTSTSELWLHSVEPSIVVLTSTPWSEIRSARFGGRSMSPSEFQRFALDNKHPLPLATFRKNTALPPPTGSKPKRVQSLDLVVRVANWDRDVATDGVEVRLLPLTSNSDVAAVDGVASVRLIGRRRETYFDQAISPQFGFWTNGLPHTRYRPIHNEDRYVELGRWAERISSSHFGDDGVLLRLPFRGRHPDDDLELSTDAIIECRLSIRGRGVVAATAPLELRLYSPLRDALQVDRGTRFFLED